MSREILKRIHIAIVQYMAGNIRSNHHQAMVFNTQKGTKGQKRSKKLEKFQRPINTDVVINLQGEGYADKMATNAAAKKNPIEGEGRHQTIEKISFIRERIKNYKKDNHYTIMAYIVFYDFQQHKIMQ
ncbi:hypothetical protein ABPG72_009296, partial [Tetrahymena utriculariae]